MNNSAVIGIVLAAGKGTRMKSEKPKVLHEVFFAPMVHHVLDALSPLSLAKTIVVTGHMHRLVEEALADYRPAFVFQEKQLGTGHAVLACQEMLSSHAGPVLILCGDTPLIRPETLRDFLESHRCNASQLTIMTTEVADPSHYGRILSDSAGNVLSIVEEKDAGPEQKKIREINAGIYCVDAELLLSALVRVGSDNKQGEIYLTDIVGIATADGVRVQKYVCEDSGEILGVNSRRELALAHQALQARHLDFLMDSGVTIPQPHNVSIAKTVVIGRDSVIQPFVFLAGKTEIGCSVTIDSFVKINDCHIGDGCQIGAFTHLRQEKVPPRTQIHSPRI
ncbi:bifunctional UDP-N-acetylglucosamine diphosphorylase/glucosamine-1-phosphate N-acetyltransferase GlmU [Thiovibrio sp. JS02]